MPVGIKQIFEITSFALAAEVWLEEAGIFEGIHSPPAGCWGSLGVSVEVPVLLGCSYMFQQTLHKIINVVCVYVCGFF